MEEHDLSELQKSIFKFSRNKVEWELARSEWFLDHIELSKTFKRCECGHAIKELCYIRNRFTGHTLKVGNVCINYFDEEFNPRIIAGLKKIIADPNSNLNGDLIRHAYRYGIIDNETAQIMWNNRRKKNISQSMRDFKRKVIRKILNEI